MAKSVSFGHPSAEEDAEQGLCRRSYAGDTVDIEGLSL